jgi:pilus assembly protein FimV
MKAFCRALALVASMSLQLSSAWALSVGQVRANAVLGQPLSLAIPVTVADGQELLAECVTADIVAGDYKVPAQGVRTRVVLGRTVNEGIVRITTIGVVEEPVLNVTVSVGCNNKSSRTVTLFADPPPVNLPETATPVATPSQVPAAAPTPASTTPAGEMISAPAATSASAPAPAVRRPAPPRAVTATVAPPRARIVARPARVPAAGPGPGQQQAQAPAPLPPSVLPKVIAPATAVAVAASAGRPALKLEAVPTEPGASEAAKASTVQATATANAVLAAAEAASAAQARLKTLEDELAKLRLQAKQQAEQYTVVQTQLSKVQPVGDARTAWLVPLLGAMAGVFGLTSVWLWLRSRRALTHDAAWWDAQAGQRDTKPPKDFSPSRTAVVHRTPPDSDGGADSRLSTHLPAGLVTDSIAPARGLDSMMSPRTVQGASAVSSSAMPPPIVQTYETPAFSVDEQIDVEQQADFFIALGHDDEAVDLLMANLRSTGGGSPLPYLKLLEIHRRLGQREDYERTRTRFNQRFNSVAPDWSADPSSGRALEQYPMVMGRIQHAWQSPLDAMVELEALLFGRSDNAEVFDLPAYQEVLLLYQVARELHTSEPSAGKAEDVDVLLPIGGDAEPPVGEGTIVLRPEFNAGRHVKLDLELDPQPAGGDVKVTAAVPSVSRPGGSASGQGRS